MYWKEYVEFANALLATNLDDYLTARLVKNIDTKTINTIFMSCCLAYEASQYSDTKVNLVIFSKHFKTWQYGERINRIFNCNENVENCIPYYISKSLGLTSNVNGLPIPENTFKVPLTFRGRSLICSIVLILMINAATSLAINSNIS